MARFVHGSRKVTPYLRRLRTFTFSPASVTAASTETAATTTATSKQAAQRQQHLIAATEQWFHTIVLGQKLCPFAAPLVDNNNSNPHHNKLRIVASSAINAQHAIQDVAYEARLLMKHSSSLQKEESSLSSSSSLNQGSDDTLHHETTLVVFDENVDITTNISTTATLSQQQQQHKETMDNFLDFVRFSWRLQEQVIVNQGLETQLQLVLFHPRAVHQTYNTFDSPMDNDGENEDDGGNAGDYTIRSPYPTVHLLREADVLAAATSKYYPNLESLPARNQAKLQAQGVHTCRERLRACYDKTTGSHSNNAANGANSRKETET